jgi:membrane AbrB-like protein
MNFHFSHLSTSICWIALLLLSSLLSVFLNLGHFPAAVLLGCMFAAIFMSTRGAALIIPKWYFALAQGVVGCLMARSLQPQVLNSVGQNWPIFVGVSLAVFSASVLLGWIFMRRGIFPGSTAVWGLAPGAAAAMVVMAEAYGADVRLVAFMQYLRVALVTTIAAVIAHFCTSTGVMQPSITPHWFAVDTFNLAMTLFVVVGVSTVAYRLAIPGGSMILPLILATVLQYFGLLVIDLPLLLLTAAYAVIGWSIGLRFNSAILRHAWRSLPQVLMAISSLIILSGVIAVGLWQLADYDLFTAYLASSPGGADSVAVIAATTTVDAGFVMSMQLSRFLFVLIFGPIVSKFVATRMK